jgi:formate hydrogenlyase subunit 4
VSTTGIATQLFQILAAIGLAPLFLGWVNQCRAWLQNRTAPPLIQPYRMIRKLLHKDALIADSASPLFRLAPYILFGTMAVASAIIPSLGTDVPFAKAADAIALVGLFATARVFVALAAMDIGTAFGTMGARREMMVGFLAEPALLMVFFTASLICGSTALPSIAETLVASQFAIYPGLAFAAVAFVMVLLAENARIPVDNPATHLELTMIHEAMVLEYSARHLALIEWASALKLLNYACIGFALFLPWGLPHGGAGAAALFTALPLLVIKLIAVGAGLALIETVSAKLRIFRLPEFLAMAFLLAVLGLLVRLLLGS